MAFDSVKTLLCDRDEAFVCRIAVPRLPQEKLFVSDNYDMVSDFAVDLDLTDFLFVRDRIEELDAQKPFGSADEARVVARALCMLISAINSGSTCLPVDDPEMQHILKERIAFFPPSDASQAHSVMLLQHNDQLYLCFDKHLLSALSLQRKLKVETGGSADSDPEDFKDHKRRVSEEGIMVGDIKIGFNDDQKDAIRNMPSSGVYIVTGGPGTGKTTVAAALLKVFLKSGHDLSDFFVCAPTGRASDHLAASVQKYLSSDPATRISELRSGTIHSLIGAGYGRPKYDSLNPLPYRVIIADEFSMADLVLAGDLFDAVDKGSLLIILGDPDQLPSVEAGAVLNSLIQVLKSRKRVAGLSKNMRSQEEIKSLMDGLNNKADRVTPEGLFAEGHAVCNTADDDIKKLFEEWTKFAEKPDDKGRVMVYYTGKEDRKPDEYPLSKEIADRWFGMFFNGYKQKLGKVKDALEPITLSSGDNKQDQESSEDPILTANDALDKLFDHLGKFKILCCLREGAFGCVNMNSMLEAMLKEKLGKEHGIPVIITRNDKEKGLFNGNMGVILTLGTGDERSRVAVFRKGSSAGAAGRVVGGYVMFPLMSLPENDRAFAVTVHKSQGSEYGHVLTLVPYAGDNQNIGRMLTREIFYTAVTRAKQSVYIICHKKSLADAVKLKALERRHSIPIE
ncbi:MAG: AAA family ATPase [Abditibacteriota bacterium]|nr:AAA family ATPase [Abditibacteriota bacterium]